MIKTDRLSIHVGTNPYNKKLFRKKVQRYKEGVVITLFFKSVVLKFMYARKPYKSYMSQKEFESVILGLKKLHAERQKR